MSKARAILSSIFSHVKNECGNIKENGIYGLTKKDVGAAGEHENCKKDEDNAKTEDLCLEGVVGKKSGEEGKEGDCKIDFED